MQIQSGWTVPFITASKTFWILLTCMVFTEDVYEIANSLEILLSLNVIDDIAISMAIFGTIQGGKKKQLSS